MRPLKLTLLFALGALGLLMGSGLVEVSAQTRPDFPYPPGNWMDIHGEDNLRFKVWNSSGCLASMQTCETAQICVRIRFRRKSDPRVELVTTKILTMDNDRAVSGTVSGGSGSFAFGSAAGRGRTVTDAASSGSAINVTTVTAGTSPVTITTAAHTFPPGQVVPINISGTSTTPSVNGVQYATAASTTTFTIPVAVTSGCAGCGGTFSSFNTLTSATAAFTSNDVGKAITVSAGAAACQVSDPVCQGPKMPSSTYQGQIIAVTSGTTAIVKPSFMSAFSGATLIIEPTLLADSDGLELGDGWLTNIDVNFWGGGYFVGQTYVEGEINNLKNQTGTAFNQHAGWKLFSDYMETSYHIAWPGSHTMARHKVGDTHGWTRTITMGTTGGQNPINLSGFTTANPAVVTTAVAHGMSIGSVQLVTIAGSAGGTIDGLRYATILSATTFSVPVSGGAGGGAAGTVTGPYTIPAAGADWTMTVPLGAHWEVLGCRAAFTSSATVAFRGPTIIIDDVATNIIYSRQFSAAIAQSETHSLIAGPGIPTTTTQGVLGGWIDGVSLPTKVELTAGGRVRVSTSNIQAGDQWSGISCQVNEWIEQATSGVGG